MKKKKNNKKKKSNKTLIKGIGLVAIVAVVAVCVVVKISKGDNISGQIGEQNLSSSVYTDDSTSSSSPTSSSTDSSIQSSNNSSSNNPSSSNSGTKGSSNSSYPKIKFSEMYETVNNVKNISQTYKSFNDKKVELSGYMAVQSPLDKSFIYLVNQPYVSCPFCAIGDVTKLEIIPVYMANGKGIEYTENGVTVRGKLEVAEKVDSLEYTTQCRIYADSIEEAKSENVDTELQRYYAGLSEAGMIIDIQTLQMDIEYLTNPTYMKDFGSTKREKLNGVVNSIASNIDQYLSYIKECPDIVAQVPSGYNITRGDLLKLNEEFIALYNKQIILFEKFAKTVKAADKTSLTDEEVNVLFDMLMSANKENLKLYDEFTAWNNKLRE